MLQRMRLLALSAVGVAALVSGCGEDSGSGGGGTSREIIVDLQPIGPEGTTGSVSISGSGSKTNVVIDALVLSGVGGQTAGIHTGTCDNYAPRPEYDLGGVEEGIGGTTLDVPTGTFLTGEYVVVLQTSGADPTPLACGAIEGE
jgi:hypothetical protein